MKLKHTQISKGSILYHRRYPTKLKGHPQCSSGYYTKAMGVKVTDTKAVQLAAWDTANRVYEDYVRVLGLTNTDALAATESLRLAGAVLKAKGLVEGSLADNPLLTTLQNRLAKQIVMDEVQASGVLDAIMEADPETEQEVLTPAMHIAESAWKLLTSPKATVSSTVLLSECWGLYADYKGIDTGTREGKREHTKWLGFLAVAGDTVLTQDTVHEALDTYVAHRSGAVSTGGRKVKGSSVAREVAGIIACIRHCTKAKRLPIVITKPSIKDATRYTKRHVFSHEELKALVAALPRLEPWKEAVLLVMLQTGCITTELQRATAEELDLDSDIPCLRITGGASGELKTASRLRTIPLTVQVERLRELKAALDDGSGYALGKDFSTKSDSNASHQLNTVIRKIAPETTVYSTRHSLKHRAMAAGIDTSLVALIGGWRDSLGINTVMLGYGSKGHTSPEVLKQLQTALNTINSHLL